VALVVLAVVIDLVDTFWITSLRGAVGAIDGVQHPFRSWVRTSVLMFPLYVLAVAAAAGLARRWFRAIRWRLARSLAVAGLVLAATVVVGVGAVAVNAVRDYHRQSAELTVVHALHANAGAAAAEAEGAAHVAAGHLSAGCDALCEAKRSTLEVHQRAVFYGGAVLVISNAMLVAFLVVLWGLRLWSWYTPAGPLPASIV
jgi:hypothetical protein